MTRAYLRLDPAFDERKEAYPDGAYRSLIAVFCMAETQTHRGRFRSVDYVKRLLGKHGRHVSYLIAQGDLIVLSDGRVYVVGWDEWQEGDVTVAERVQRIRTRRRNGGCNGQRNGDVTADRYAKHNGNTAVSAGVSEAIAADRASADVDKSTAKDALRRIGDMLKNDDTSKGETP
jgi:hypothetical protein